MIKTIDDFLPERIFSKLESLVDSSDFAWYRTETAYNSTGQVKHSEISNGVTTSLKDVEQVSLANTMYDNQHGYDSIFLRTSSWCQAALGYHGFDCQNISRIRFALQQTSKGNNVNNPHLDAYHDHTVLLLYLTDADGDTLLYNNKVERSSDGVIKGGEYIVDDSSWHTYLTNYVNNNEFTEKVRVSPKRNRAVVFNGDYWHSSSAPKEKADRIILNANFT